ncbi:MAG TPA: hypothetical protein VFH58_15125 [Acidimicrobiales bacterium]|nr:hypothetical protein [Acidimicrobiales bacterium]
MSTWAVSLDPVREALLGAARADADRILARAGAEAEETRRAAAAEAEAVVSRARAAGQAAADQVAAAVRARARRRAHQLVLAAREAAFQELRSEGRSAAEALARAPGYRELVASLTTTARDRLGPDARVVVDGPEGPGVVAEAGRRRVDLRLAVLADRALESLASDVEELWR